MKKETLLSSMPKLILAVVLIVCIGAVMGLMGLMMTKKQMRVETPKKVQDKTVIEEEFEILYPTKDTIWKIGETYKIQWRPSNLSDEVVIKLYKIPAVSLNLKWEPSNSVPNIGYYSFTIFEGLETGKYQFVIIEDGQTSRSEEFIITSEEVKKEIKETVNLEKCFKIENKSDRANCYKEVAEETQNLLICDRLVKDFSNLDFMKQQCYVEIAKIKKDETICEGLWEIYSRRCYHEIAIIKKDSEICAKIKKSENLHIGEKDDCYVDIAMIEQDSEICKAVQNDTYKSWCSKIIQKQKLTPEEVVCGFLHDRIFRRIYLSDSVNVTEEYKQKIAEIKKTGINYDPVTYTQENPDNGIIIEKATIQNDVASLRAILEYSGSGSHYLIVDLIMVNNEWKINDVSSFEK